MEVVPPQLAVAGGYGPQSTFDTPVPLAQVPFPDVLPLPRTLLSGSSSLVAQATLSASGQLPSEVVLPPPISASDGVFLAHQQTVPPASLPPIRDVFDPALRRYSTAANEALTALQRDELVSFTLPRNLHLHQATGSQLQRPNQQHSPLLQQQQQQQSLQQQQQQQLAIQQIQPASSSRLYGGAATLGRRPRDRQLTTTQRPGVRWNPAVQMIPPASPSVTAASSPTSQELKEAS